MKVVYVGSDNKVALNCPGCHKSKVVDVSRFLGRKGAVNLRYRFHCDKCDCGHKDCNECLHDECSHGYIDSVRLERRIHVRKDTKLSGTLTLEREDSLPVQVLDLSRTGARIRIPTKVAIKLGDNVKLDFLLDDKQRTLVVKDGTIVRETGRIYALNFEQAESYSTADKAIGFYLMR